MKLEFMFKGMPVGYFEGAEYPGRDGQYRYMPYRGAGHYYLTVEMHERGRARCFYNNGTEHVSFTVSNRPGYGLLELADFDAVQGE